MNIRSEDLLTFLANYGIVNGDVTDTNMNAKEEFIAKKHKSKITLGSDGRWRTRIEKDGKQVMVAKKNKSDLINYLFELYGNPEKKKYITFKEAFERLKDYKKELVDDNTILKYECDYKRYFLNTDFENLKIKDITRETIELFLVRRIKELKLTRRPYQDMFGYINQTLRHAYNTGFAVENTCGRLSRKDYYRYCLEKSEIKEQRIASEEEIKAIVGNIRKSQEDRPDIMTGYAVEFATLTGMRVGEISALMWECVDFENKTILIDKAEVFHQRDKTYIISKTKNGAIRYVPMTTAIEELLLRVKAAAKENGYISNFVFAGKDGQIHKNTIVVYARNKSYQVGLNEAKTVHTFRRTINSRIRENGISIQAAASMLGHSESVNARHYTYDVTDMEYKRKALEAAQVTG